MMKKVKILLLVSILLIAGMVLTSLWLNLRGREASGEREDVPKVSVGDADVRLEKILFVEDKHGQKTWELEAKSIQQYQNQNIMELEDVRVTVYMEGGRTVTISGNKGKVHQDSKDMELVGDVLLTSSDGYRLKTHSVSYHHSERKVTTPDLVEVEGKEIQLVGTGMFVDMEAKTIKVLNQVKTRWKGGKEG